MVKSNQKTGGLIEFDGVVTKNNGTKITEVECDNLCDIFLSFLTENGYNYGGGLSLLTENEYINK